MVDLAAYYEKEIIPRLKDYYVDVRSLYQQFSQKSLQECTDLLDHELSKVAGYKDSQEKSLAEEVKNLRTHAKQLGSSTGTLSELLDDCFRVTKLARQLLSFTNSNVKALHDCLEQLRKQFDTEDISDEYVATRFTTTKTDFMVVISCEALKRILHDLEQFCRDVRPKVQSATEDALLNESSRLEELCQQIEHCKNELTTYNYSPVYISLYRRRKRSSIIIPFAPNVKQKVPRRCIQAALALHVAASLMFLLATPTILQQDKVVFTGLAVVGFQVGAVLLSLGFLRRMTNFRTVLKINFFAGVLASVLFATNQWLRNTYLLLLSWVCLSGSFPVATLFETFKNVEEFKHARTALATTTLIGLIAGFLVIGLAEVIQLAELAVVGLCLAYAVVWWYYFCCHKCKDFKLDIQQTNAYSFVELIPHLFARVNFELYLLVTVKEVVDEILELDITCFYAAGVLSIAAVVSWAVQRTTLGSASFVQAVSLFFGMIGTALMIKFTELIRAQHSISGALIMTSYVLASLYSPHRSVQKHTRVSALWFYFLARLPSAALFTLGCWLFPEYSIDVLYGCVFLLNMLGMVLVTQQQIEV